MDKINKHGIKVRIYRTSHWGHWDKDNVWHNAVFEVPHCCFKCKFIDDGESGEYGDILTPPSCTLGIWMPTKTGVCKRQV